MVGGLICQRKIFFSIRATPSDLAIVKVRQPGDSIRLSGTRGSCPFGQIVRARSFLLGSSRPLAQSSPRRCGGISGAYVGRRAPPSNATLWFHTSSCEQPRRRLPRKERAPHAT